MSYIPALIKNFIRSVRKTKIIFWVLIILVGFWTIYLSFPPISYAQTPTPTPPGTPTLGGGTIGTKWVFDPVVTEVGKGADRARQLLWWIYTHPSIYSAPVFAKLWGFSRNIVYVFVILVIVAFGLGLIISKRQGGIGPIFSGVSPPFYGANLPGIFFKVAAILLYVTFSYIIILGLIQTSEIMMKFFIEFIGGKDLFNIFFAGGGNSEANYIDFKGYRDTNVLNMEMVNTSLSIVRFTSLTYNIMAIILILRAVILWFLLVISPFLALLMPFIFIRNTGWIWIGVFFQWLFYGPLVALFISVLANIWKEGIPYPFDFSRVNQPSGQIYPTSINILYGGPAQTLTPTNSANYVDTYAEYVISLVMLWAAIILPWLLLRIFRDYCCEMIAGSQATLKAIYDRMRQYPPPSPTISPPSPTTQTGRAIQLPFRSKIEERIKEVSRIKIEDIKEISKVHTEEIAKAMNVSVTKLSDISRFETNELRRVDAEKNLNRIAKPDRVMTARDREHYSAIRNELKAREEKGDKVAERMMTAAERRTGALIRSKPLTTMAQLSAQQVSRQVGVAEQKVNNVLKASSKAATAGISMAAVIPQVARESGLTEDKVKQIISTSKLTTKVSPPIISNLTTPQVAREVGVPEGKIKEVLTNIPKSKTAPSAQTVSQVAKKTGLTEDKVKKILSTSRPASVPGVPAAAPTVTVDDYEEVKTMWLTHYRSSPVPITETIKERTQWLQKDEKRLTNVINLLASSDSKMKKKGLEQVADILPFLLLGGFSNEETIVYLKAKLSAAKQIMSELEEKGKVVAKTKEELEKEEVLVEVEDTREEKKKMTEARRLKMEIPYKETKKGKSQAVDYSQEKILRESLGEAVDQKLEDQVRMATKEVIKDINRVTKMHTKELAQAFDLYISKLTDLYQLEIDELKRLEIERRLDKIAKPEKTSTHSDREKYGAIKHEIESRAQRGDKIAQNMLDAAEKRSDVLIKEREEKLKPKIALTTPSVAKEAGVPEGKVKEVLSQVPKSITTPGAKIIAQIANSTGLTEAQVKMILLTARPQVMPGEHKVAPVVTVDDYEEVKTMWFKYYHSAPVPESETIKDRNMWLVKEEKMLTNVINLLLSEDKVMKRKGLEQITNLLPFLLLGGFSDAEALVYLQAKLAGIKQVQSELEAVDKAKDRDKTKKDSAVEEELVEISKEKKEEGLKLSEKEEMTNE